MTPLENKLLDKVSPCIMEKLPVYQTTLSESTKKSEDIDPSTSKNDTDIDPKTPAHLFPKHYTVPITPDDLSHLLAADLLQHKRLKIETLIYLQTMDPHISYVKNKSWTRIATKILCSKKA